MKKIVAILTTLVLLLPVVAFAETLTVTVQYCLKDGTPVKPLEDYFIELEDGAQSTIYASLGEGYKVVEARVDGTPISRNPYVVFDHSEWIGKSASLVKFVCKTVAVVPPVEETPVVQEEVKEEIVPSEQSNHENTNNDDVNNSQENSVENEDKNENEESNEVNNSEDEHSDEKEEKDSENEMLTSIIEPKNEETKQNDVEEDHPEVIEEKQEEVETVNEQEEQVVQDKASPVEEKTIVIEEENTANNDETIINCDEVFAPINLPQIEQVDLSPSQAEIKIMESLQIVTNGDSETPVERKAVAKKAEEPSTFVVEDTAIVPTSVKESSSATEPRKNGTHEVRTTYRTVEGQPLDYDVLSVKDGAPVFYEAKSFNGYVLVERPDTFYDYARDRQEVCFVYVKIEDMTEEQTDVMLPFEEEYFNMLRKKVKSSR